MFFCTSSLHLLKFFGTCTGRYGTRTGLNLGNTVPVRAGIEILKNVECIYRLVFGDTFVRIKQACCAGRVKNPDSYQLGSRQVNLTKSIIFINFYKSVLNLLFGKTF
jgi:hypothetical protein